MIIRLRGGIKTSSGFIKKKNQAFVGYTDDPRNRYSLSFPQKTNDDWDLMLKSKHLKVLDFNMYR